MSLQRKVAIMTGGGVTCAPAAHDTRAAIENSGGPQSRQPRPQPSRHRLGGHDAGQQNPAEQTV